MTRNVLLIVGAVLFFEGCADHRTITAPTVDSGLIPSVPNYVESAFDPCYHEILPGNQALTVNQVSEVLSDRSYWCYHGTSNIASGPYYNLGTMTTSDASVASLTSVSGGYRATGVGVGTATVSSSYCLGSDPAHCSTATIEVTVSQAPLTVSIDGPTDVVTSLQCNLEYSVGVGGGSGGYSMLWETDGTLKSSGDWGAIAAWSWDYEYHWIQVTVTDSQGHQETAGLIVSSGPNGQVCNP